MATVPEPYCYDCIGKVLILGDPGVGKTSLMLKYIDGTWDPAKGDASLPLGKEEKTKLVVESGKKIFLKIFDTVGQDTHGTLTSTFYRGAQGVIIVYDVTDEETFYNVKAWMSEANRYCPDVVYALAGNKTDLPSRKVSIDSGRELAKVHNIHFVETSVYDMSSVEELFRLLAKAILDQCNEKIRHDDLVRLDDVDQKKDRCC
ncbi:Ras family protein [Pelomyxa schiedti]|nr:Ras family protein [Pelomyxa schiedti]